MKTAMITMTLNDFTLDWRRYLGDAYDHEIVIMRDGEPFIELREKVTKKYDDLADLCGALPELAGSFDAYKREEKELEWENDCRLTPVR